MTNLKNKKKRTLSDIDADRNPAANVHIASDKDQPLKRQRTRRELFIRGLAPSTTTEDLVSHFSEAFPIKHGVVVTDPQTGECKGYGFVTFADADDAAQATTKFQRSELLGRRIKLDIAEPRRRDVDDTLPVEVAAAVGKNKSKPAPEAIAAKERRKEELMSRKTAQKPPKLIVRNLPWSIRTEQDLEKLFMNCGKIKQAVLPTRERSLLRGFGFVTLRARKNAENAIERMNGKEIDGRTIAVDWAVDKDVWQEQNVEKTIPTQDRSDRTGHISVHPAKDVPQSNASDNEENICLQEPGSEAISDDDHDHDQDVGESDNEMSDEIHPNLTYDSAPLNNSNTSTLFIRNVPFTVTDQHLHEHFSQFGALRYARVVLDSDTERPRGTAFVSFKYDDDAKVCLRNAPRQVRNTEEPLNAPSVLQNEELDPSGRYTLLGRVLHLARAVDKSEAKKLADPGQSMQEKVNKDKRRLFLLNEGTISSKSSLYESLSQGEREMREASYRQRKALIQSNPALHLSLTRLSIRNMPRTISSKDLKTLAREAVVGFAKDVKAGKREKLSKEELARDAEAMSKAEKERKSKSKGIVKQAKIVFESKEGTKVEEKAENPGGRSRGYGFIEYHTHRSALMGLRWLNGHAVGYKAETTKEGDQMSRGEQSERRKRLIVEFAIDNAQVMHRRVDRQSKARVHVNSAQPAEAKGGTIVSSAADGTQGLSIENTRSQDGGDVLIARDLIGQDADKERGRLKKRQAIIGRKRAQRRERRG